MSLTDTNREARRQVRSAGLRDLRFAGTVAAGLVAGVLGVGALSAPLLGWTDWPDGLKPGGGDDAVKMKAPATQVAVVDNRPSPSTTGPAAVPGIGTSAAVVLPSATGGGTGAGTGSGSTGAPERVRIGSGTQEGGSGTTTGGSGFAQPNVDDSDNDGMPDVWEQRYGLNPNVADENADADADGIRNADEYFLRTSPTAEDSDGDGIPDAMADSDGDGLRNATELRLGTVPWIRDTNQDGQDDGLDDADGDGVPNPDEDQAGTDPGTGEPLPEDDDPNAAPVGPQPDPVDV